MADVLAVLATSWGLVMALSPVLQIRRMLRTRSSNDVSIAYFAVLGIGFVLWITYGASITSWPLMISNSAALVGAVATSIVALGLREKAEHPAPTSPVARETEEALVRMAQAEAARAIERGDAPFGAVLADAEGRPLLEASNTQVSARDPSAHAEINLLRAASRELGLQDLDGLRVVTNAEPCSMCGSALVKARVATVHYGAPHEPHMDPPIGMEELVRHSRHRLGLHGGVLVDECVAQIAAARQERAAVD